MNRVSRSEAVKHAVFIVWLVCLFSVCCSLMSQRRAGRSPAVCSVASAPYGSPALQRLLFHSLLNYILSWRCISSDSILKCKNLVKMICIQPQFAACLLTNIQYISYSLADHFHPFLAFPPFVCVALGPGWAGQPVDILLGDPKVSPGQKRYISQQRVLGLPWGPLPVGPSPPLRHMQQASW